MNTLNDQLRDTLASEERALLAELDQESGMFELVSDTFSSRMRPYTILVFVFTLVSLGLAVWCLVGFIQATELKALFGWALGLMYTLIMIMGMKIWYWMELQKHALTRELKRSELRLLLTLEERSTRSAEQTA